jgi:CheY-like chemotaxis protein
VVEDDAPTLELMAEILTSMATHVSPVADPRKALELVGRNRYDAIFLDLNMPHMDGFELIRSVRCSTTNRTTPVVIVTGSGETKDLSRAFELGATLYLTKPIDKRKLIRLFETVRGHTLRRAPKT